jgi:hypothetical protein
MPRDVFAFGRWAVGGNLLTSVWALSIVEHEWPNRLESPTK